MVSSAVKGPLTGVRILDLTHVWAGPLAVRTLADLGATVVKVERPLARGPANMPATPVGGWLGDPGDPAHWNRNGAYIKLQRNRFGLALDYKTEAGRTVFLELVAQADVVIENYSAQAMAGMALDYDQLKAANPRIIYVTMPGYGSTGPYSDRVAFGTVIESLSALTSLMGYSADEPRNSAQALPDAMGGMHTVSAVAQALVERAQSGQGVRVELSLHEAGVTISGPFLVAQQLSGAPEVMGNRHPNMTPHGVFACAGDDQWLALACEDDRQWQALHNLIGGFEDAAQNWSLAERRSHANEIEAQISQWTGQHDKFAATEILQSHGIPAGPVQNAPEMLSDPQLQAREFFVWRDRFDVPLQGDPVHRTESGTQNWQPSPFLGEHNHAVLQDWLDYTPEQIKALEADGVLVTRPPD